MYLSFNKKMTPEKWNKIIFKKKKLFCYYLYFCTSHPELWYDFVSFTKKNIIVKLIVLQQQ